MQIVERNQCSDTFTIRETERNENRRITWRSFAGEAPFAESEYRAGTERRRRRRFLHHPGTCGLPGNILLLLSPPFLFIALRVNDVTCHVAR